MRKLRWQLLIIFLTGLVVGILLLGEQPQTQTLPQSTPEPVRGGVYTEALTGSLMRLNPLLAHLNPPDRDVTRLIFSGLVRFDSRGNPQPDLAEEWGFSADGTLYNVTLREGIRWHDGKPLTTADVLFTLDLIRNGGDLIPADLQAFWKGIEAVQLSDRVIQFRLPEAFAPFLDYLTFGVLPQHLLGGKSMEQIANDDFNLKPVGSGPYQFSRLIVEDGQITGVALSVNPEYYLAKPFLEEVVFLYFPDASSAWKAYLDGRVQGLSDVPVDILPDVLGEEGLSLYTARLPKLTLVFFNLENPEVKFFQEKAVRRALGMAINRQGLIDRQMQGQAIRADGPILPGTWAYYDKITGVPYDPTGAKDLLKSVGYTLAGEQDVTLSKDGVYLKFSLVYPDDDLHRRLAEALQASWADLGVDVSIEPLAYDQLVNDRLAPRAYQAALVDLDLMRSPDPDPYPFWDQAQANTEGQNYSQWNNRMASEYLEQARTTVDRNERARFYRNFQVVFNEELPALPLFYSVYNYAVSSEIQGIRIGPLFDPSDRFANIGEWFLAGRQPRNPTVLPTFTLTP